MELDYIENRINDFERAIFPKYPILSEIKKELLNSGAKFALMTGSGSCICGYFDSQIGEAAHRVAKYGTVILTQLEGDMDV